MRLFPRLFLSHLTATLVALIVVFVISWLLSAWYYQLHVDDALRAAGATGLNLLNTLEEGHRQALLLSLLSAFPLAVLFAAATSHVESRRVAQAVKRLAKASQAVAAGAYETRVTLPNQGELSVLAANFNEMAAALAKAEKERLELIGVIAHELRTPLAALQGYAEALADGVMPAETATRAIRREAGSLRRMAHDLLLITRVEAGVIEVRPERLPPATLLHEAYERFASAFEEREVTLTLEPTDGLPVVWADAERSLQVLSNLLSNALRHTPKGGSVTLAAHARGNEVVFAVTDTGPGIPQEHQARVFERFYRLDEARSRSKGGIGVGLTICKGLVEAMGGRIWLESAPSHGASFFFTLPLAPTKQGTNVGDTNDQGGYKTVTPSQ